MSSSVPAPDSMVPDDAMMLIDAYLAGELSGPALADFEARLAREPGLRSAVEAQRSIEASLREAFAPSAAAASIAARIAGPESEKAVLGSVRPSTRSWTRRMWMGLAASVAVVGVLVAVYVFRPSPADPRGPRAPGEVYAAVVDGGFVPPVVCPNDPDLFAQLVESRLGTKLVPSLAANSGIALTGWGYSNHWGTPLGPGTLVLLATQGETKLIVIMDKVRNDKPLAEPGKGLHMFRKVTGDLVLYEISPLEQPILLPALDSR
jgi:hypothetical protein